MERSSVALPPHSCGDPRDLTGALASAHELAHDRDLAAPAAERAPEAARDTVPDVIRRPIFESWRRARAAGVRPTVPGAPQVYEGSDLADVRDGHPLSPLLPMMRDLLRRFTDESEHLMVVADADGHALWTEGAPGVRREADLLGVEGFCWSERSVGTNGVGTPLATGVPQYVFSAEHVASILHHWSCAGAPITDPDSGRVLGCIDVGGTLATLHPAAVALVGAVARVAETRLELEMRRRDERLLDRYRHHLDAVRRDARRGGTGALATATGRVLLAEPASWNGRRLEVPEPGARITLPDGGWALAEPLGEVFLLRPVPNGDGIAYAGEAWPAEPGSSATHPPLTLALLGGDRPTAWLGRRRISLSLRHAEILTLLAVHPRGLNGDRLSLCLYGDEGSPVTVRAEIHRLRAQLGDVLRAKPYQLACEVDADFLAVRRLLDRGEVARAVRLARGELLPQSEAPAVRAERDELSMLLRRHVLEHGDTEELWAYAQAEPGRDDLEVLDRLVAALPPGDPRRDGVATRGHRLRHEEN